MHHVLVPSLLFAAVLPAQVDWQRVLTAAAPTAQYHHSMVYDLARGRTVVFGGTTTPSGRLGETWEYDGTNWTQMQPATSPSARVWARFAYDLPRGVALLFGGDTGSGETWQYDGTNWTQLQPATQPPPRMAQAMWFDVARQKVMMFGGNLRPAGTLANDTWEWNGTDWTQRLPANTPPALYSIDAAYDLQRDRAVVFGGAASTPSGVVATNATWEWDGTDWAAASPPHVPAARWGNKLAYHMGRQRVVMVGGRGAAGSLADTWEFDGFDWHQIATVTGLTPVENHAAVYDFARQRVVSYAGYPPIHETWEYGEGAAGSFVPYGAGCAGSMGVPLLEALGPMPQRGQTFGMTVRNLPPAAAIVFGVLGLSKAHHGALPLPLPLATVGMPGCTLFVGEFATFAFPQGAVTAFWNVPIPNLAALQGLVFHVQAAVPDPGANAAGLTVSNAADATIG